MKLTRPFSYAATPMIVVAAAVVLLRVPTGRKLDMFVMLAFASIGATELALALSALIHRPHSRAAALPRLLIGVGAFLMGYSMLNPISTIPFVGGALLYSSGILFTQRHHFTTT